jgi:hypothetical protein
LRLLVIESTCKLLIGSKKFVLVVFFRGDYFLVFWFLSKKIIKPILKKIETVSNQLVLVGFWFGYFILKTKNYIVF